jgi:quinol monooxygenase YgiN
VAQVFRLRTTPTSNDRACRQVYKDAACIDVHKATPHFKLWSDFKESGGVVSQVAVKADAIDFSG